MKQLIIVNQAVAGTEVKTKDFDFLLRKEVLILCCFLLALTFSQIALEQIILSSNTYAIYNRISQIEPYLKLNISLLESLGVFLPPFIAIFLFFYRRGYDFSWLPPTKWLVVFSLLFVFILAFPLPKPLEEEFPIVGPETTTTIPPTPGTTSPSGTNPMETDTTTTVTPSPSNDFFSDFITEFRSLFIIGILLLPFLFAIIIQRRSKFEEIESKKVEDASEDVQEKQYMTRTILECYYQASTALEERGADSSPILTPSEFTNDVIVKDLTKTPTICDLTDLFEEAKFSNHEMSSTQVEFAKSLASKIVFPPDSKLETEINQEKGMERKE